MSNKLIAAARKAATVLSLPVIAGGVALAASAPAEAYPYYGPGQYSNVQYVDLNQLCASENQGWAYDRVPGNPAFWSCQSGSKVPLATIPADLRDIVATGSSDPRTAFVVVSYGCNSPYVYGSVNGYYNGSGFQVY